MSQTKAQLIDNLVQPITGALGSASAPTFSFTSDPNTGIYSPGADQLAISTGGSGRLFVDGSGNVSVGNSSAFDTAAGRGNISINGSSTALLALGTGGAQKFAIYHDGTNCEVNNLQAGYLELKTQNQPRLRITSAGLVGIGSSSPVQPLEVVTATGGGIALRPNAGNATQGLLWYDTGGGPYGFVKYDHQASALSFGTVNSERMRLDSSGRLGIGTTSPSANGKLTVANTDQQGICFVNTDSSNKEWRIAGASTALAVIQTGVGEALRVDSGNRLLVGTSSTSSPHLIQTSGSGTANAASLAGFTIGNSNSEYPSAGCNIRFTSTSNSYQYNGSDYAAMIRYGQNSGRIETFTAPSGTAGNTISFTAGPYVANTGTSWTNSSDERLKTDLIPIEDAFAKVGTLRAVTGRYKTDESSKRRSFLIAQDVQAVLPEAVDSVDPDSLGLSYSDVIPLLVAALKESKERIEQLEAEMAEVKAQFS